jgi:cytoskeleton-associated protein 5
MHLSSNTAHYGDDVYEFLAASFDDPSATIVYPYVYRILNSATRAATEEVNAESRINGTKRAPAISRDSPVVTRPQSPQSSVTSGEQHRSSLSRPRTASVSSANDGYAPTAEEPDPDAQLVTIINHISSETTGAMHKEGITELHQFLKAYPHKRPRVEKLLESTGTAFRKYITRALASRAAEDSDRDAAVAHTLSSMFPQILIRASSNEGYNRT